MEIKTQKSYFQNANIVSKTHFSLLKFYCNMHTTLNFDFLHLITWSVDNAIHLS